MSTQYGLDTVVFPLETATIARMITSRTNTPTTIAVVEFIPNTAGPVGVGTGDGDP